MNVRPGRSLVATTALCLALAFAGHFHPLPLVGIPLVAAAAAVAAVIDYLWTIRLHERLRVACTMPVSAGRCASFAALVEIAGGAKKLHATLRVVLPPETRPDVWLENLVIDGPAARPVERMFCIELRGKYRFGPVFIRIKSPFRMLEIDRRHDVSAEIRILPEVLVSREYLSKRMLVDTRLFDDRNRTHLRGEGIEFETISAYSRGDDQRKIDWRASARHGQLMVRRYNIERHRDVLLLLDCGRLMGTRVGNGTKVDCAVNSALMLGRAAVERGDRPGLGVFDDRVITYQPPSGGKRTMRMLVDRLYDVKSNFAETNFNRMFATLEARQTRRALIVILSDIVDAETSVFFRSALARLNKRHLVLYAALRTPLIREIAESEIGGLHDAARKAVAFRLLREREKALFAMHAGGLLVLDVEPDKLTVPLLNKYIEVREKNLV